MSVQYMPKSLTKNIPDIPVLSISVVASEWIPISASSSTPKTNHWVYHLAISQNESIRLDPSPSANNNLMVLIVTKESSLYPPTASKVLPLSTAENLTVGNVIDKICASRYDQYRFTDSGQGCRYWIGSVTALLRLSAYVVDNSQVQTVEAALQVVWDKGEPMEESEQSRVTPGTFC